MQGPLTRAGLLCAGFRTRFYSPDRTKIFSGMCFCTSDVRQVLDCILRARADMQWREQLPRADVAAIAAGVQALGGQWKAELTREVTHLFVLAPTGVSGWAHST